MAGVATMISAAMQRPRPLALGNNVWVITPSSTKASWARTCDCWLDGKTSMIRLINSAAESINRIIDVFPSNQQSQVRAQLAFVLEGVITQTLLPKAKGRGRCMAAEIMIATPAIRALIRDDKIHQIYSAMQSGKKFGMQTMNDALYQLYTSREVSQEECERVSSDPKEFLRMIGVTPLEDQEMGS